MSAHVASVTVGMAGPTRSLAGHGAVCSCGWRLPVDVWRGHDDAVVGAVEHAVGHPVVRGRVLKSGERRP